MLQICPEFDSLEGYTAGKEHVHKLAVYSSSAKLLNFGKRRLETVVDPREHVMSTKIIRRDVRCINIDSHVDLLLLEMENKITVRQQTANFLIGNSLDGNK